MIFFFNFTRKKRIKIRLVATPGGGVGALGSTKGKVGSGVGVFGGGGLGDFKTGGVCSLGDGVGSFAGGGGGVGSFGGGGVGSLGGGGGVGSLGFLGF